MGYNAFHLQINQSAIESCTTVILPGDPGRVAKIAALLDEPRQVASHREFNSMLGYLNGQPTLVCSTGIGGPSTAIAIEELAMCGLKNFLRVGTTGALQPAIDPGDLIISTAAVRMDGASFHIAPPGFPAVADVGMIQKLSRAAEASGLKYHLGITASSDTFYQGQNRKDSFQEGFLISSMAGKLEELQQLNVLSFEMEAATVLTQTAAYGLRGACILGVLVNRCRNETPAGQVLLDAQINSIQVAVESLKLPN